MIYGRRRIATSDARKRISRIDARSQTSTNGGRRQILRIGGRRRTCRRHGRLRRRRTTIDRDGRHRDYRYYEIGCRAALALWTCSSSSGETTSDGCCESRSHPRRARRGGPH